MSRFRLLFLLIALFPVAACSVSGTSPDSAMGAARSSHGTITLLEMESLVASSAHDAVLSLRPSWLRAKGTSSIQDLRSSYPVVFVDNSRYGDPSTLRQVLIRDIDEIAFLNPRQATTYHGTGYPAGIIMVKTRR